VAIGYNNVPVYFPQIGAEIARCAFINNRATAANMVRVTNNAFSTRTFSGRGGALGVFYNESYHNISLIITDTSFENNYARSFGGALYLVKFGEQSQNVYKLRGNNFTNNAATLGGGAMDITFFSGAPNTLMMNDCNFIENVGQTGGALSLYLPYAGNLKI
jgi:predicted outer membrane repeat protein